MWKNMLKDTALLKIQEAFLLWIGLIVFYYGIVQGLSWDDLTEKIISINLLPFVYSVLVFIVYYPCLFGIILFVGTIPALGENDALIALILALNFGRLLLIPISA